MKVLEKQLDNIQIGSMKLHVNIPKYRRYDNPLNSLSDWKEKDKDKTTSRIQKKENSQWRAKNVNQEKVRSRKSNNLTYAWALKRETKNKGLGDVWRQVEIEVIEERKEWLQQSYTREIKIIMWFVFKRLKHIRYITWMLWYMENNNVEWKHIVGKNRLRGVLTIWNINMFHVKQSKSHKGFVIFKEECRHKKEVVTIVNVYSTCNLNEKLISWGN